MDQNISITKQIVNVFHQTFYSKISRNIKKFPSKHSQIHFISNVIQIISYQISIQTLSYQNPKFNIFFSGDQTSNGAQSCGTFQMGGWPQIVPFKVDGTKHY